MHKVLNRFSPEGGLLNPVCHRWSLNFVSTRGEGYLEQLETREGGECMIRSRRGRGPRALPRGLATRRAGVRAGVRRRAFRRSTPNPPCARGLRRHQFPPLATRGRLRGRNARGERGVLRVPRPVPADMAIPRGSAGAQFCICDGVNVGGGGSRDGALFCQ